MDFRIYGNKSINTYKIPKLSEEKYVYFSMLRNEYSYYYPYYPDEPDPYASHQGYEPELHRNSTILRYVMMKRINAKEKSDYTILKKILNILLKFII